MDHISERHNIVISSVSNEPSYLISCHASTQLISVIMYVNVISYSQRVTKLARTLVRDQVLRTVESVPRAMKRMKKEFAKVGYQRPHFFFFETCVCNHVCFLHADIDECKRDESICKEGTYCLNVPGKHRCNRKYI